MYNKNAPAEYCKDREVYIVDFSFNEEGMRRICDEAKHVTLIDHHKTALENLKDFKAENYTATIRDHACGLVREPTAQNKRRGS